jgi:hypothetical protein
MSYLIIPPEIIFVRKAGGNNTVMFVSDGIPVTGIAA